MRKMSMNQEMFERSDNPEGSQTGATRLSAIIWFESSDNPEGSQTHSIVVKNGT